LPIAGLIDEDEDGDETEALEEISLILAASADLGVQGGVSLRPGNLRTTHIKLWE
jgi:hypothetical protein